MDSPSILQALILGIIEGLTEFLPISSTGHLILVSSLMGSHTEQQKVFEIAIQAGAIFAVCWEYRHHLLSHLKGYQYPATQRLFVGIFLAFCPLAMLGVLFHQSIKAILFNPISVSAAFILGGLAIFWVEKKQPTHDSIDELENISLMHAVKIGVLQALALIPGVSRSGASIIGAMAIGVSRKTATEFSFLLAIPTLLGATVYELSQSWSLVHLSTDWPWWVTGFLSAFFSAFVCIRWLLRFVQTNTLVAFAWYRIVFGLVILLTHYAGLVNWT